MLHKDNSSDPYFQDPREVKMRVKLFTKHVLNRVMLFALLAATGALPLSAQAQSDAEF